MRTDNLFMELTSKLETPLQKWILAGAAKGFPIVQPMLEWPRGWGNIAEVKEV